MAPPKAEILTASVVFAPPGEVREFRVRLPAGASVRDAVVASGVLQAFPQLALGALDLGVFNRPCTPERLLHEGDRVEIYRPLLIEPKAARHLRVAARRQAEASARPGPAAAGAAAPAPGRPKPAR
jgi:putative ubiquitin-RnfH superfamily antitoxin RatB of RatAB toxin-antitoxin module